jgi:predicted transcriptional regulator
MKRPRESKARTTGVGTPVRRGDLTPLNAANKHQGLIMDISDTPSANQDILLELTADLVAAYVSNNPVPAAELPNLIAEVHAALGRVGAAPEQAPLEKQKPAVNPRRSIFDDYIICLEDGKKFKSLKRHLMTHYGLTPEQYREKWGLEPNYPMVAPNYAAARSALAKKTGLGRKR